MSLSEGETSYICIHGANISVLLASFAITPGFTFGVVYDYSWLYFWRRLRLLLALLLASEVISGLFFFPNVKNFRPHQRERQFY